MYSKINASQFDPLHFNRLSLWDGDITGGIIEFYSCQSYCLYQWSTVTQTNGYHLSPTLQHFWKSQPGTIYNICNIYIYIFPPGNIFSCFFYLITNCDFFRRVCDADVFFAVCNLTAGEEPRCISPATKVMNCRAQRASAVSG